MSKCEKNDEIWKCIILNDEPSKYYISNYGHIKSFKKKKAKILKPIKLSNGYYVISLCHDGIVYRFYIHRLVGMYFIPIPEKYNNTWDELEINHKNGNKGLNAYYNLEWVNSRDNKIHAYRTNLAKSGTDSHLAMYTENQIKKVCEYLVENNLPPREISKLTNVSVSMIHDIKNHGSWHKITDKYDFSNYTPKQQKYTMEAISQVKEMLMKNIKCSEIARITSVPLSSVYYYKEKYINNAVL